MRSVSWLFAVGAVAGEDLQKCPTSPEIMILQDSSLSLKEVHNTMSKDIGTLLAKWAESYGTPVKIGFASFTDKPLPMRGWGGRYATDYKDWDTCYDFGTGIGVDYNVIQENFDTMEIRNGGDFAEAQYEALLYSAVDPNVGFTPSSITRDDEDRLVVRLVVMITDDVSHKAGDAKVGIEKYNSPPQDDTYGGWGDFSFAGYQGAVWVNETSPFTPAEYGEMAEYLYYLREGYDLSPEETERLEYLRKAFAPEKWDSTVTEHDGLYTVDSCKTKDYPSLEILTDALTAANIIPVVLVTAPSKGMIDWNAQVECVNEFGYEYDAQAQKFKDPSVIAPCLVWHYTRDFENAGVKAIVTSFDSAEEVVEAVRKTVLAASDYACHLAEDTTTEEEPTTTTEEPTTTTEEPTTTTEEPTTTTEEPTTTTEEPVLTTTTEEPVLTTTTEEPVLTTTTEEPIPTTTTEEPIPTTTTEEPIPTTTTEEPIPTTTTEEPIPATTSEVGPIPVTTDKPVTRPRPTRPDHDDDDDDDDDEKDGPGAGVIAGATGGAIAGVAAIAGLLYKQFGAGMFGHGSTPDLTGAEQVDSPENPLEREGMEEVTMDMFQ